MNITHLSLQHIPFEPIIELLEWRNLKKLELSRLSCNIPFETLEQAIRLNPALESLILRHVNFPRFSELIAVLADSLINLKELVLIPGNRITFIATPLSHFTMDKFFNALQHIETLGLTVERQHQPPLVQSIELCTFWAIHA